MVRKKYPANKHHDDIKLAVFNLFCDGKTVSDAAREVGISIQTANTWKRQKWPNDWEIARKQRIELKQKLLEEESLEKVSSMNRRQQVRFQKVLDIAAAGIAKKINSHDFSLSSAADILFRGSDAERKLYVAPEVAFAPKPIGMQAGVGAFAKPNGELGVLATLNQMWEEGNIGKPDDTKTVESTPDSRNDTELTK